MAFSTLFPHILVIIPNEYIRAIIVGIFLFVIIRLLLGVFGKVAKRLVGKTKTDLDDMIFEKISTPFTIIALMGSLHVALLELNHIAQLQGVIDAFTKTIFVIFLAYIVLVIVQLFVGRGWIKYFLHRKSKPDETAVNMANNFSKIIVFIGAILFILVAWGVELGPFLAGLGIAGIAVALALQPILANIFSGMFLAIGKAIKVGDMIKVDKYLGIVKVIGLRTTRIRTFDNEVIIFPNAKLADATIKNYNQPDERLRVYIEYSVEYGVDPEFVKKITIEEVEKLKEILDPKERVNVLFLGMGDSSLNFKVMFWVKHLSDKWPAHQEALTRIYRRLYKESLGIPFPQRTVWMRDEGKARHRTPYERKFDGTNKKFYNDFGHEFKN